MSNVSQKPMITTIIPTYRRPKLLRRAIRSVLNQTYPHFQVCVYDNASGDETASVVAELAKADSRVKYHCHSENIGAMKNFTYGMEHVETPFFSFLSDDDILLPEFYETAMEGFEKFPDAVFSAGSTICMTDKGKIIRSSLLPWQRDGYYTPPEGLFEMIEKGHPIWTSVLFRKEAVKDVGPVMDEGVTGTDRYFLFRIAVRFPFVISKKACAIWVSHPLSFCTLSTLNHVWPGWLKMISNLTENERIPLDVRIRAEQMLTERLKQILFRCGFKSVKQKNFEDAYKVVDILCNHFHLKIRAISLYAAIKFCQFFPPAYYLVYLNKIRRFFKPDKSCHWNLWQLQKQFGDYARFLEL
jgi:glycosyltransferase involved in cell wall biosynthesis